MKIKVSYKMPKDHDWHKPEFLELTRVPSIDEHIVAGPFEGKLCRVTLVIHTPANANHAAEVYGDWVERDDAVNAADNFDNY